MKGEAKITPNKYLPWSEDFKEQEVEREVRRTRGKDYSLYRYKKGVGNHKKERQRTRWGSMVKNLEKAVFVPSIGGSELKKRLQEADNLQAVL